jgi:hypothetical protein
MFECCQRPGFTTETGRLFRACIRPRQQHLECNRPIQFLLPGPEDNSHAAAAEHGLHFIARNPWKGHSVMRGRTGLARFEWVREERVNLGLDATQLP